MTGSVTLVTWNIWSKEHRRDERASLLAEQLAEADADVICLQEVTPWALGRLRGAPSLSRYAAICPDEGREHATLVLSRLPVRRAERAALTSGLARDVLVAEVTTPWGAALTVATSHLESRRESGATRARQLDEIFALLAVAAHDTALAGDFNFDDGWAEDDRLRREPGFGDLWSTLRPGEAGYTVDTTANAMAAAAKGGVGKRTRYDRVLLRSRDDGVQARSIELVGVAPDRGDGGLYVSDHFGLRAVLGEPRGAPPDEREHLTRT